MSINIQESDLIEKIKKKDKAAIKELYVHYSPIMLSICRRYIEDVAVAKDLMHDGFIKIITKIDTYSGTGSFEGWMKRIVIYTAINFYNKNKKEQKVSLDSNSVQEEISEDSINESIEKSYNNPNEINTDRVFQADLTINEITDSIASLPEKYRVIINLFVIEKYPHKEIAVMLNIDDGACRTRLSRGREMLKKILYLKSIERVAK
jgi:RNA polymerase sigma-70 factor (ECF subfamily)